MSVGEPGEPGRDSGEPDPLRVDSTAVAGEETIVAAAATEAEVPAVTGTADADLRR